MKKAFVFLSYALLFLAFSITQPTAGYTVTTGQVDTFEDGTTQNWFVGIRGGPAPSPPVVEIGGPGIPGNLFMRLTATGAATDPGGKLTVINQTQWTGNYAAAGVATITMDVNNLGFTDLYLRLLLADPGILQPASEATNIAISTTPVLVPVGSGWVSVTFPVTRDYLTAFRGNVDAALGNVTDFRIFHNLSPAFPPPSVQAQLGVDNIKALATLPPPVVFSDVPPTHFAFAQVGAIAASGITAGCQPDNPGTPQNEARFCPESSITRAQMAVFIETSLGNPPLICTNQFNDVPAGHPFCGFIEGLAADGITGGCGGQNFCPNDPITRGQMAVFIEAALGHATSPCAGQFSDVPLGHPFCSFVELLAADGITGGCGNGLFCPDDPVTRAQMAVFLVAAPPPLNP